MTRTTAAVRAASLAMVAALVVAACTDSADSNGSNGAAPAPPAEAGTIGEVPADAFCLGLCLGPLAGGRYHTREFTPTLSYTAPAGWENFDDRPFNFALFADEPVAGEVLVMRDPTPLRPDPPDWDARQPVPGVGTSADEFAAWLVDHPELAATEPEQVTVGGLAGVQLDVEIAPDSTNSTVWCDTGEVCVDLFGPQRIEWIDHLPAWGLVGDNQARVVLLTTADGTGTVLILAYQWESTDHAAFLAEQAQPIIDSFEFSPAPPEPSDDLDAPSSTRLTARYAGTTAADLGYYEYQPPGYEGGEPAPLLVFLHGFGEHGDGDHATLGEVLGEAIPDLIRRNRWPADRPFVMLAPQSPVTVDLGCDEDEPYVGTCAAYAQHDQGHPDGSPCHTPTEVYEFISYALDAYQVDPDRVYLTGLSCGGFAIFEYLAVHGASQVAAAVPVAGEGRPAWDAAGCDLAEVPIWAFHGNADDISHPDGSSEPLAHLADCPSGPVAELTMYPGVDHDSWTATYNLSAGHDIYDWLLHHTRSTG